MRPQKFGSFSPALEQADIKKKKTIERYNFIQEKRHKTQFSKKSEAEHQEHDKICLSWQIDNINASLDPPRMQNI